MPVADIAIVIAVVIAAASAIAGMAYYRVRTLDAAWGGVTAKERERIFHAGERGEATIVEMRKREPTPTESYVDLVLDVRPEGQGKTFFRAQTKAFLHGIEAVGVTKGGVIPVRIDGERVLVDAPRIRREVNERRIARGDPPLPG